MALRALFFIAAVALLAPHESGFDSKGSPLACGAGSCTVNASLFGKFETQMFARLAEVKAEIAAAQAARARS